MLRNMNPEIFSDNSKFVYTMKTQQKKVPQFKNKSEKNSSMNKNEIKRQNKTFFIFKLKLIRLEEKVSNEINSRKNKEEIINATNNTLIELNKKIVNKSFLSFETFE